MQRPERKMLRKAMHRLAMMKQKQADNACLDCLAPMGRIPVLGGKSLTYLWKTTAVHGGTFTTDDERQRFNGNETRLLDILP